MIIDLCVRTDDAKERSRLSPLGTAMISVKERHSKGTTLVASPCLVPRILFMINIAMFMFRNAVLKASAEVTPSEIRENHTHTVNERYDTSTVAKCLVR